MDSRWQEIENSIIKSINPRFKIETVTPILGRSINQCFRLQDSSVDYFIKINSPDKINMLRAEAEGLQELALCKALRTPELLLWDASENYSFLICEYLSLSKLQNQAQFAEQLAALHSIQDSEFGWQRDNFIGSTPQINTYNKDWSNFWCIHRLGFQLKLAEQTPESSALIHFGEKLLMKARKFFDGHQPVASLLHGDLWSGNVGETFSGLPVIFDPSIYYGDREAEIAMTELFGGFSKEFYSSYNSIWPLDSGYSVRKDFYNLYHVLNHYNLFGGSYKSQAVTMINKLLSELN